MSEHVYLLTLCLPLVTILLVFCMRYFSAALQAWARLANDQAYRRIAEQAVAGQSEQTVTLSAIQLELSMVRTRLTAIEKILKDVE